MFPDIASVLADGGVVFTVVEPPKKFPLLGMTRLIEKRVPVIQPDGSVGEGRLRHLDVFPLHSVPARGRPRCSPTRGLEAKQPLQERGALPRDPGAWNLRICSDV